MGAKRIILNIGATYGRSIVTFVLGLFTTRWILAALGKSDFGLWGVVGSVMFFITFLNEIFSQTISRFYAYAIGEGAVYGDEIERVQKLFNTSLLIHLALPAIALAIGFPVGEYAIRHWLTIPADRIIACCWVFRLTAVIAIIHMVSVPFNSLYFAYQNIVALSVYTLARVVLLFFAAFSLRFLSGDKLILHAFFVMVAHCLISLIQMARAYVRYPACRVSLKLMRHPQQLRPIISYFSARVLQGLGWGLRGNGSAILINSYFDATANASFNVAYTLSAQATSFSNGLAHAFSPAITTAAGAKDMPLVKSLSLRSCKFGTLLILVFGIPLIVEMDNWLHIWLENPPENCYGLCVCMVLTFICDYLSIGHHLALSANGRVFSWQVWEAILLTMTLPIGWVLIFLGYGLVSVGVAYVVTFIFTIIVRLIFSKSYLHMQIFLWVKKVLIPILILAGFDFFFARMVSQFFNPTFFRLVFVGMLSASVLLVLSWFIVFDFNERNFVIKSIQKIFSCMHE